MELELPTQSFCPKCLCPSSTIVLDPPYLRENIELTLCSVCLDFNYCSPKKLDHSYFLKKIQELSSINDHQTEPQGEDTILPECSIHKKHMVICSKCLECFKMERKVLVCKYYLKPIDLEMQKHIWKEIFSKTNKSSIVQQITPAMIIAEIICLNY